MPLLFDSMFSSVALGHLLVDLLNGQRAILLAYLSVPLGLSNTLLATISTIYVWAASASQPVFGWLSDRVGPRWVAALGILWMGGLFALAMLLPGYGSLACLVLASLGSAAFHPAGTAQATLVGRTHLAGRETTAASMFFLFGQLGYAFGPMLGGPLLDRFGPPGLLLLAALTLPVGANAAWQLRRTRLEATAAPRPQAAGRSNRGVSRTFVVLLALIAALQAWAQQNMITFLPKYLVDLGLSAQVYGLVSGLFVGGSAIGGVIGGNLADRFNKYRVAGAALALASLPLLAIAGLGWSPWLYLLVPLAGSLTGAVHSIVVVTAQRNLPAGMGLISGLTLGYMFSAGALGTLLTGPLADAAGFPPVFLLTAGLALLAALLVAAIPKEG